MGRRLYVGNLPYSVTEEGLTDKFSEFGTVESSKLITDRDTGRSKGFGFVEMSSDAEAKAAIVSGDLAWINKNIGPLSKEQLAFLYKRLEREAW